MIGPSDPRTLVDAPALTLAARRRQAIARAAFGQPVGVNVEIARAPAPSNEPPKAATSAGASASSAPRPVPARSRQSSPRIVLALASLSLLFAIVAVVLSVRRDAPTEGENAQPTVAIVPEGAPPRSEPSGETPLAPPARAPDLRSVAEPIDSSNVLRALRRASFDFAAEPDDALRRFQSAFAVLGDSWLELDRTQRIASLELSVEFLLRASETSGESRYGISSRAAAFSGVDALLARDSLDPSTVTRSVWSSGLATRLLRERAAAPALLDAASARVGALGVGSTSEPASASFERGAQGALRVAATKLAGVNASDTQASREAWGAWDRALAIATSSDPVAARDIALHAADAVLRGVSMRPGDTVSRERLIALLARIDWSSAGDGRRSLLDWLDDPSVYSTRELAIVTQWLASNASDSGLGVNDTLSSAASGYQRSDLRGRLAARWTGGQSVISASVLDRWAKSAIAVLESPVVVSDDPIQALRGAAEHARLSRAAALLWRGEADAARAIVDDPTGATSTRNARPPRLDALSPRPEDGRFALRFLSASQNAQDRIDLLRELVGSGRELGPIDAEVVFEQAMFGTPSEVRRIAQRITSLRSDDPAMINAALESLPRAPRTAAMGTVYEDVTGAILPSIEDPDWARSTRSALVRRLLDILTGGASLDPADSLAQALAESHADRSGTPSDGTESSSEIAARSVSTILAEARAIGGIALEPEILSMVRRFDARRALALGEIQRFAVEATNAAEALSLLVALERPAIAPEAQEVIRSMRERVNETRSAPAQILLAERASLAIWNLRLGGGQ